VTESSTSLPVTYQGVLREYLAHPDEATLRQAYDLGRAAMAAGLGIFEIVRLHHQALAEGVLGGVLAPGRGAEAPDNRLLESFLLEVLSPFEAAHRGFRAAIGRLEHLNAELADNNTLLQELSAQVLTAQEEERRRISRELHDELGQALIAVNVAVAMLKKQAAGNVSFQRRVGEAEQLLARSMETVHAFARELRPAMLDHLGLHSALRAHLAEYTDRTGIQTELVAHPDLARLDSRRSEALFRVAQEALTNVFKHAEAAAARIDFASDGETLAMEISDNGRSFSVEEKLGIGRGDRLGLLGMRERIRLVGGTFAIQSIRGSGTRLSVRLTLPDGAGARPPDAAPASRSVIISNHEKNICLAR